MNKNEFLLYQSFIIKEDYDEMVNLLSINNLKFKTDKDPDQLDSAFGLNGSNNAKTYRILLQPHNFKLADQIQLDYYQSELDSINKDYYLFSFTNEELYDVILKSDEWSKFDFLLTTKILKEKGLEVNQDLINALKKQRNEDLVLSYEGQSKIWIYIGYFLAIMGGFLGLVIGLYITTSKNVLPDGGKIYEYPENERKHGRIIMILSIIFIIISLFLKLNKGFDFYFRKH